MFLFAFNLLMNKKSLLNFKYLKNFQLCPIQLMLRCHPLSLSLLLRCIHAMFFPSPFFLSGRASNQWEWSVKWCAPTIIDNFLQSTSSSCLGTLSILLPFVGWWIKMEIEEKSSSSATANDRERGKRWDVFNHAAHTTLTTPRPRHWNVSELMAREGRKKNVECVKGFNVILISSLQTRFRWKRRKETRRVRSTSMMEVEVSEGTKTRGRTRKRFTRKSLSRNCLIFPFTHLISLC